MSAGPHYSRSEDQIIREYYPTEPLSEVGRRLPGRSLHGIGVRACRLGVSKRPECREVGKPLAEPVLAHLTEAERGYLAGLIDGEGCLRLSRSRTRSGTRVYHVQVSITNTSPTLLEWLKAKLPGNIYSYRKQREPWRQTYCWKLSGNRRAISFLAEISSYVVIKRRQADLLAHGYVTLSPQERESLYLELASLKKTA